MKVYFLGSISGKRKYLDNYKAIVDALRATGVDLIENTLEPTEEYVHSLNDEEKVGYYKKVLGWINKADIVVAEGSFPSIGVGFEISLAIEKGKPVVVLCQDEEASHFLEGLESEKVSVIKYTLDTIHEVIKDALDYASDQVDTRFNFFISPKHQNYLDWISKNKRIPRAVYLRRLIEKDMEDNDEYKQ